MESLNDIAGTGVAVKLAVPNITARWVQMIVSGAGTVKYGGSTAGPTNGLPIPAGGGMLLPPLTADGLQTSPYSLSGIYAYIPVGATLSVAYEPFN